MHNINNAYAYNNCEITLNFNLKKEKLFKIINCYRRMNS